MDTKALRQKILDLAIRGKLVPQDPNDEPASVLLERIREQKKQMVKEGKLKAKDIKNDSVIFVGEDNLHYEKFADGSVKCIEDEIPFELPEGWAWARLGSIANIVTGRLDANAQTNDGEYPFFTCGEEVFKTDSYAFDCNAILLGGNNATGDFKMHRFSGKFNAYQRVYVITTFPEIDVDYLYNHIRYYLPRLQSHSIGSQTRYLKLGMITELLIALPASCEQKTISKLCDKYLDYCVKIASEKNELKSIIKNTKSKILDLAIRGQLVPQNPDDEPASVLLNRIRAEKEELIKQGKIKRDKKESIIFKGEDNSYYETIGKNTVCIDEELPFNIPDGWRWSRLQNVSSVLTDGTHKTPIYSDEGYIFLSSKNVTTGKIDWENVMYIPETLHEELYKRLAPMQGDILLAKNGTTGVAALVDKDVVFDIYVSLALIRLIGENLHPQYILNVIGSSYVQEYFKKSLKGIGVPNLHLEHIRKTLIPIPPYAEQKQIVEFTNKMSNMIEKISVSLL